MVTSRGKWGNEIRKKAIGRSELPVMVSSYLRLGTGYQVLITFYYLNIKKGGHEQIMMMLCVSGMTTTSSALVATHKIFTQ